jgi:serine protease Do
MGEGKPKSRFLCSVGLALAAGALVGAVLVSCRGQEGEVVRVELGDKLRALSDTQEAFAGVAALSKAWVVSLTATEKPSTFMDVFFSAPDRVKGGSGFMVEASGWILTNRHVVKDASSVTVSFADGKEFKGVRYVAARDTDLAFVKIDGGPFPVASLGDSDSVRVGDWAIAIGSPFSFDQTLTVGVISAKGRKISRGHRSGYETFLQTDAAINSGNSGGPLLNLRGEVIGVNTAIFSPTRTYAGIGFAIPINRARNLIQHLEKEVTPSPEGPRPWIGVEVRTLHEAERFHLRIDGGLVVKRVEEGSPAEKAKLQVRDVLLECDGKVLRTTDDLGDRIASLKPGDRMRVKALRGRQILRLQVEVGERR